MRYTCTQSSLTVSKRSELQQTSGLDTVKQKQIRRRRREEEEELSVELCIFSTSDTRRALLHFECNIQKKFWPGKWL